MTTRGPSENAPARRPGSALITPRISKRAWPMNTRAADLQAELRDQVGPDQRAVPGDERVACRAGRPRARTCRRADRRDRRRAARRGASPPDGSVGAQHRRGLDDLALLPHAERAAPPRATTPVVAASHGRVDWTTMSAPVIARASRVSTPVTWSMIERIAAMAPTPMAMQTKKKISRRHAPRSSRPTIRRTKPMRRLSDRGRGPPGTGADAGAGATTRPSRSDSWTSARAASAASCVTSTSVVPRRACTSNSRSMTCWPLVESRLPVGSSAMITAGSFDERPRHRDALLLAAGELRRIVVAAPGQARLRRAAPWPARRRRAGRRSPSARARSRTRSATAPGGRTGTRSRWRGRAAAPARPRRAW